MLWELKRTVSVKRFFLAHRDGSFEHPQKVLKLMDNK